MIAIIFVYRSYCRWIFCFSYACNSVLTCMCSRYLETKVWCWVMTVCVLWLRCLSLCQVLVYVVVVYYVIRWFISNDAICYPILTPSTLPEDHWCTRDGAAVTWLPLQEVWTTQEDHLWSRTTVCIQNFPGTLRPTRSKICHVYCLPPPNWWTNRTNEPRNWSLPADLLWKKPRKLDKPPDRHRICA